MGRAPTTGHPGPSPTAAQRRAVTTVATMLERLRVGWLELELPDGRRRGFGDPASALRSSLEVSDWRFFPRLLHEATVGVGASYMDGHWRSSDLVSLIRIVIANRSALRRLTPAALLNIATDRVAHELRDNRLGGARRNIEAHYDLSNALYERFLDPTMTYSSAVFESPSQSLEAAQRNKYRRLAELARIEEGNRVLEIGCGWGGFAVYLAQTFGCHVTGVTLSQQQATYARDRVAREGLEALVDIQLSDYRQVAGRFDRVVSIEMLEAVGHRHLGSFFATVDRLLGADGLAALQVITIPEQRYANYRRRPDFIQRYIFPGGHLPSLEAMTHAMGRHTQLYVESVDNIGMHYAETLRRWREGFLDARDAVHELGFDDRFVRMWEFYLAYCEGAFLSRYLTDLQLVLTRPLNATLGTAPYGGSAPVVREADAVGAHPADRAPVPPLAGRR